MNCDRNATVWIAPDRDFEELYQKEQYDELIWLANENQNLIRGLCQSASSEELQKTVRLGMMMLSYFERGIQRLKSVYSVFLLGKLKGRLESLNEQRFSIQQNQMAEARAKIASTKYLDQIVSMIELRGAMSQTDLCEKLNLQKSTLSEALKKIRETQLVKAQLYGKYKVYTLTDEGIRYAGILRKNKIHRPDIEETLEMLKGYLHDDETRTATVHGLQDILRGDATTMIKIGETFRILDHEHHIDIKCVTEQILETINVPDNERSVTISGTCTDKQKKNLGLQTLDNNVRCVS